MNPEPEDEQAPPEIRGGDRPSDYIPEPPDDGKDHRDDEADGQGEFG